MSKVYLVTSVSGDWDDFSWWIECICKNIKTAEKEKLKLEQQKEYALTEYHTRYGNDFYQDLESMSDCKFLDENEELYDEITDRVYLYQARYSILKKKFKIEERELL